MTRRISIIASIVGAALLLAVPAWGDNWASDKSQQAAVQKHEAMLDARERALGVNSQPFDARSDGLNRIYGLGEYSNMLDNRERALVEKTLFEKNGVTPVDPRSEGLNRIYGLGEYADARSVELNRIYGLGEFAPPVVADDRFRIGPTNAPVLVAPSPETDVEWPQIGIGLGLGIAFVLVLYLTTRTTRRRPLAH